MKRPLSLSERAANRASGLLAWIGQRCADVARWLERWSLNHYARRVVRRGGIPRGLVWLIYAAAGWSAVAVFYLWAVS